MGRNSLHITRIVLLLCLGFGPLPEFGPSISRAQDASESLRAWMLDQRSGSERIGVLRVTEHVNQTMDGGFGTQQIEFDVFREMGPDADSPGRDISRLRVNGREAPPDRGERVRRTLRSVLRPEIARQLEAFRFPIQEISRMKPSRPATEERRDGVIYWRVDMTARNAGDPIERLTLWFDRSEFHLVSSLAVASGPGPGSVQIRTDYTRIGSLDLPNRREIEGSAPVRRRMRMFTMLFEQRITYSDYQLSEKQ